MSQRPNILIFYIDDLGWKDLACYGSDFYETPHLDQLAREGMRFTDAYATCPVCSPSRASLLTGKYPARLGVTDWIDWGGGTHPAKGRLIDVPYIKQLPAGECTLAHALRAAGYATWHVGKWHLGGEGSLPEDHGFDLNIGGTHYGMPPGRGYFSPWSIPGLEQADVPENIYLTDYLTDRAIDCIRQADDQPFFLNFWHYAVHTPIHAKPEDIARFKRKAELLGLDKQEALIEGEPFPTEHKKQQRVTRRIIQSNPVYAAMIWNLDQNIGRVLAALDETGRRDNTLVLFSSDNGGLATAEGSPTCNAPLAEGKGWMYEGGTREPLLVRLPGIIPAGSLCTVPVSTADFYPTILDLAGLPLRPEQHCDGVSLRPLLEDQTTAIERDAIFWHYPHYGNQGGTPGSSVRLGDYKLIEFFEDGRLELYNLREDPGEKNNLAVKRPKERDLLHQRLKAWREEVEAKIPQANPDWQSGN